MVEQPPDFFASDDAQCRQLGFEAVRLMNPEDRDIAAENAAKSVCESCVFIEPCREWGMTHSLVGVMGGMTSRERHNIHLKIRREHRRRATCDGVEPPY